MKTLRNSLFLTLLFTTINFYSYGQTRVLFKSFPVSTPEEQGISSQVLDSLMYFVKSTNQNIHHLTILRNNHTILDTDFYPYSSHNLHDLASVTKSITSLLIGIAIDKGYLKDENEPVLNFFPEITKHNQQLNSLTIKDLLTMRSGFKCGLEDGEKALSDMRKTNDWVHFVFNLPMVSKPGTKWSYCSCNFYLLGEIIYRTTKMIPQEFAKKYLFGPLQIKGTHWLTNYKGINHGWGDLLLHPIDMAKIGQMVLNKGKWKGKQILSEQWLTKSLATSFKFQGDKGYGYGWWTNDRFGGYNEAVGRGEQTISIIPSKNMVVIMLGGGYNQAMIGKYVLESIKSDKPLSSSFKAFEKLKASIKEAEKAQSFKPIAINNNIIQKLNRRTIVFDKNIAEIDSLQFDFTTNKKGMVTIYGKNIQGKNPFIISKSTYALGSDLNVVRLDPKLHLPVAIQAWFKNKNEFVFHFNQFCRINNFYFHFTINGDDITTIMEETTNHIKANIKSLFK